MFSVSTIRGTTMPRIITCNNGRSRFDIKVDWLRLTVAGLIVDQSLLSVTEDLVCRGNISEFRCCSGIIVKIWVKLFCEAQVCVLDIGSAGASRDLQHVVVILA